jgi:hypothetical protein
VTQAMEDDESFYMMPVSLLGADTEMFKRGNGRDLIEYFLGRHDVMTSKVSDLDRGQLKRGRALRRSAAVACVSVTSA